MSLFDGLFSLIFLVFRTTVWKTQELLQNSQSVI